MEQSDAAIACEQKQQWRYSVALKTHGEAHKLTQNRNRRDNL